jgi:hypothetical protein
MHIKTTMVQTKSGTKSNAWIEYMKVCAANYRQGTGIQSAVQGRKSKASPDKTEESHKRTLHQQTDAAIKQTKDAKGEKLATQGRERREKAHKDQEEAVKATAKKMGKAIGKKIADQTGKV